MDLLALTVLSLMVQIDLGLFFIRYLEQGNLLLQVSKPLVFYANLSFVIMVLLLLKYRKYSIKNKVEKVPQKKRFKAAYIIVFSILFLFITSLLYLWIYVFFIGCLLFSLRLIFFGILSYEIYRCAWGWSERSIGKTDEKK